MQAAGGPGLRNRRDADWQPMSLGIPSQFPSELPVAFTLQPALFLQLPLAFLLRLPFFRPGLSQHIGEPAADIPCALPFDDLLVRPLPPPGNPRQAFLDVVGIQFLRLPTCGGARCRRIGADMALPFFPGLSPSRYFLTAKEKPKHQCQMG